jgi:arylsulfatase A-like enzyme
VTPLRAVLALALLSGCAAQPEEGPRRPNVLLLCVDDLRPELGCAGSQRARTPEIDRLAAGGRVFTRHYAVFPTCGASRAAMLTGRLPEYDVQWGNDAFRALREHPVPTLPGVFRTAGYETICLGKVSHSHDGRLADGGEEMPGAWSSLPTDPGAWGEARHLLHAYAGGRARVPGESPLTEAADVPDEGYPDGILAAQAVALLGELAASGEPFFLAVGFFKPHLPFCAPRRYWDLFDPQAIDPGPDEGCPAGLGPVHACRQSGEVTGNYACPAWSDRRWDADERREMIHAYLACVAYVDAQVGKVLRALERLDLEDETIVVLWGDHGWHLGEQGLMGKHTTFESALRSALVVRAPGGAGTGVVDERLTSSLDLFPTLCELAGIAVPDGLAGTSLTGERDSAPSFWQVGEHRAEVLRTADRREVRWTSRATGESVCRELYDLAADPEERVNLAPRD